MADKQQAEHNEERPENGHKLSRRQFVQQSAAATAGLLLTACVGGAAEQETGEASQVAAVPEGPGTGSGPALAPTPQCFDDDDETPEQSAGPFYAPNSPERVSFLEDGATGTTLVLTGRVLTTGCEPVAGALVDFWHCDGEGNYDNSGYRFRGHQFAAADGSYRLETILPGLYPGRTRHIHVRVQGPESDLLTTQLYFPDEPGNARDFLFDPELLVTMDDAGENGSAAAAFDFVLA